LRLSRKIAGWVLGVVVVVALYALVGVYFVGLAWPYPVVLPDSFSLDGSIPSPGGVPAARRLGDASPRGGLSGQRRLVG
jgi:hypothetical protein